MATRPRGSVPLLIAAAVVFVGWLGWLGYLAFTTSRPEVLLRPQFLPAQVDLVAELGGNADRPDDGAVVKEVLWGRDGAPEPGATLAILNLSEVTPISGWKGPGRYILPLVRTEAGYRIAPIPRSPGFAGSMLPHVYRDTPDTRAQERQIRGE